METPRKFITANKTIIGFIAMQTYKELVRILYIDLPELRLHAAQLLFCVVLCCVVLMHGKVNYRVEIYIGPWQESNLRPCDYGAAL